MEDLTLTVADVVASAASVTWRWVLTRPGGDFIGAHDVNLDTADWQYEAFTDLYSWLGHYAEPLTERMASEERIVAAVGDWITERVFGDLAAVVVAGAPCTLRVAIPAVAADLAFLPLELARVGGLPLTLQRVSLVLDVGPPLGASFPDASTLDSPAGLAPPLRVLGLFSLPQRSAALNLRKERHELQRLVARLARSGRAIEMRSLQYGTTRERLADAVSEHDGWDVVHLSGHGRAGIFALEKPDGGRDPVSADELVELLLPLRGRVRLVTVSACESGERISRRQFDIFAARSGAALAAHGDGESPGQTDIRRTETSLAIQLARQLGCAVVGMRYPVAESFAAAFAHELYGLLFDAGMPLAMARAAATAAAAGQVTFDRPALSAGVPALYTASTVDLELAAPRSVVPASTTNEAGKMEGFREQPVQFVGRVAAMSRASQALAPRSGRCAVLIHGMSGAGKTALALELAYVQQENFGTLIWYAAPDEGSDIRTAITHLAVTLEQKIHGLEFAHLLDDLPRLRAFLPHLTELFDRNRILLVIDNADSLLLRDGNWIDDRWQLLINGLISHAGLGRLVITSRYPIAVTGTGTVMAEPVDSLSDSEAVLLAHELPRLRALMDGAAPPLNETTARGLARRVLNAVRGHPKLLELAEGQAAEPAELARFVLIAEQSWREHDVTAVPRHTADPAGYLAVLDAWTRQVCQLLGPTAKFLFGILCSLEPDDREQGTVDDVWPHLWGALELPGDPPGADREVNALAIQGLLRIEPSAADSPANCDFVIHPAVAATGRALVGAELRHVVDKVLSDYWSTMFLHAIDREADESYGWLVLYAGRAALPYLVRLGNCDRARYLIEQLLHRDDSPTSAALLVPTLRTIAGLSDGESLMRAERLLARALERVNVRAAEQLLGRLLSSAVAANDHRTASVVAGDLSDILLDAGLLDRALAASEEKIDHTRRAGLGPWTLIGAEAHRLRILAIQGRSEKVLAESQRLRTLMGRLPETGPEAISPAAEADETAVPWSVQQVILDLGREAACQLERWEDALALSAETARYQEQQGASDTELSRTHFNDYFPLLKLGRLNDAREVLYDCRARAEADKDIAALGKTLGALADVEDALGHGEVALDLDRAGLRYKYLVNDTDGIATGHHNYGSHTARYRGQVTDGLAHVLVAALIRMLTNTDSHDLAIRTAAVLLEELPPGASPPADMAQLQDIVDALPGTEFGPLLARLEPEPSRRSEAYANVLARVRALAASH